MLSDSSYRNETLADCSPLSQACIKALTDKFEDKRKFAAGEIEKMTVEFSMNSNQVMINRLIIVLGRKFCLNHNPNFRKGGLIGLAAVMAGFKNGSLNEPTPEMVEEVVRPILTCFLDADSRVRYYACESLYNVTKVAKNNILPLFDCIFDNLSKIVADPDNSVRSGAELLDRLLRDIIVEQPSFNIQQFVPRLEDYIYTMNPFTRMFIVSWIRFIDSRIDMISYLHPQLLDGIFNCLYDSAEEIKASTLNLLSEFLNKIVTRPTDKLNLPSMINTILKHAKNDREDPVQYTAITWLRQFIRLMDDQDLINFTPGILTAILPCMAYHSASEGSMDSTRDRLSPIPASSQRYISPNQGNVCEISSLVNSSLLQQITQVLLDRKNSLGKDSATSDLEPILEALMRELQRHDHPVIKLTVLDWLKSLNNAESGLIITSTIQQKLFQTLLETLSDRSDAVVKNALRVIAEVFCVEGQDNPNTTLASSLDENLIIPKDDEQTEIDKGKKSPMRTMSTRLPNSSSKKVAISTGESIPSSTTNSANISRFVQALCKSFMEKEVVLEDRGTFIIVNLCTMIKADIVYKSFAEILRDDKSIDLKFAYNLVQKLNQILLTTQPLFGLRSRLSNDDDQEVVNLFTNLYYAWCYSPIAALTLCLLTNNYRHASEIVVVLSQTDINVDTLSQIDWVIQLIESPVFASLRMRLLDVNSNQYLIQTLYGLLMILPQSEAYKRLSHRLDQVHKFMCAQPTFRGPQPSVQRSSGSSSASGGKETGTTTSSSGPSLTTTTGKKTIPSNQPSIENLMKHFAIIQNQRAKLNLTSEKEDK